MWYSRTVDDQRTRVTVEIPEPHADVVNWLTSQDMPFYARDLRAQFPEIAFDEIKQLLENCARCGLLTLLCFPSINDNKT